MKKVIIQFLLFFVVIFSSVKASSQVRPTSCIPTFNSHNACCSIGIERVKYGSLDNTTGNPTTGDPLYHDFTTTDTAIIYMNQTDSIIIENPFTNDQNVFVYIDWNDDGDFLDADEFAFVSLRDTYHVGSIIPPSHALMNTLVRMRVMSDFHVNNLSSACDNIVFGQAEDYALLLLPEPTKVQSIVRNNPTAASTTSNNMQFQVNFNKEVVGVDTSDFVLNGSAANNTDIQSINRVNGSQYLVNVATTNPTSGTIGLDIKGVDASGTNNIIEDNGVLDQQALNDIQVTNSPEFGQSFVAGASGVLTKIILRTGHGHSFTGNGVLEIYSGNGFGGSLISTSNVYFPSSPLFTDINFYLENPAQLMAGNTYTFRFNFPTASTSNIAVSAQTGNPYANGILYHPGALSVADLYFKTFVASSIKPLSSALPTSDESYDFIVPLQVSTTVDSNQTNLSIPNGGATVSYSGGVPPYLIHWSHGANTATVTGLSSGKYYVTVTDNNGSSASLTQTLVDSVEIEGVNPFRLSSIRRNNPMDSITSKSNLQFKLNFSGKAGNYMLSDFMSIGGLADSLTLNSVVYETDSSCLVNATLNSSADGTIGIGIKGVGGLPGSNGIYTFSLVDTLSVNHLTTDDYLNQAVIGQTYTAIKENLKEVVIFPKSGNHAFNGTADLKVYSGDYSTGSQALLHSESVNLSNSTAATGQTFELSNLVPTTPGNTYTITFENFSGSGSHAFESAIAGNYSGGHVVFTNFNPSNHSGFDLKIKITEAFEDVGGDLDTLAPNLNQSYQFTVPVQLDSIQRYLPLDSVTSQSNLQFKLSFNQAVGNLTIADFELTGQLADSASINALSALNEKEHLVDVSLNSSVDGSIGLGVKGVGSISGSNGIKGLSIVDTLSVDQSFTDDYLNHAVIGQTYTAIKENLKQVVIFPESVNHSFSGTADLNVYSGDYHNGSPTLIHSESVNLTSNTSASGQAFELSTLVATTPGNTYSITFENFNGSGSHALESAIVGTYPNGHVIFSSYSAGSHSGFDLKIKIIEASQDFVKDLDTLTPSLIQSYQYTIPCQASSSVQIANACNTYNWSQNGMSYTETGMYKDTIPNAAGCDSVITLDLTIRNQTSETFTADVCNSYDWQGMTFTNSGTYYDTIPNAAGCDSLMTLNLIIRNETSETFTADVCNNYDWQGMTFTQSGTYYDTIPNAAGCDSLMTLNLTIRNQTSETFTADVCNSYDWQGMTFTQSGTYYDTIPNAAGCDSLMTLNLIIRNETSETFTADVCNSYDWQGMTFTQSGTYYDTIPNAAGCDSLMTLNLTIRNQTSETFTADVCNSYDWQGMTFTQSGTYYDTIPNAAGCDSLMTLNLTIRNQTSETFTADVCNSYDWQGMTFTQSGTYYDTIPNAAGCDSLMTLNLTIRNQTSETFTADVCNSYDWQGMTFTQSGTYYDTIPNAAGCDSLMTLNLTIRTSTSSVTAANYCNSYQWQGMTFTQSGTYYDTIPNAAGCDSLMTLNLTIRNQTSETFTADVCNSYDWQGMTFTQSGTYYDTIPNAAGCDSLMTLNLTIRNQTSETFTADVCNSYDWQGMTFTQSGTYYDTIPNAAGCDSLMTLNLTIRNQTSETFTADVCNSYDWQGMTFTQSGTYYDTIPNAAGCDSLMTLNLTIRNQTSETFTADVCNSYDWQGMTFTQSGTYYDSIPNAAGCDSLMTLNLTIRNQTSETFTADVCNSYDWQGMTFTQSGTYYDTIPNAAGCDSLMTLNLTIRNQTSETFTADVCNSYDWQGMTFTQSGTYYDTIPNAAGCDSLMTLNLTIRNQTSETFTADVCNSYDWQGMTFTQSGTYYDTIPNAAGCDSLMTLNLTIRNQTSETFTADVCNSYDWQGMTFTQSGTYYDTIPNAAGCDSLMTLNLTIRNQTSETFTADVCNSYDWQGMTFTQSGTYYDTIPNAAGCDSLMTLNLTIRNQTSETFTADVCNSYDWQGVTFTQSGTYYDTIPNAAGCDSLMTLNLTIRNQTSETFTADVCNSYDWQGMTFTQSGTYYDTIPNAAGCDSLMTLNLTIRNQTSETFTADVCNSYDWQGMTFTQSGTYYDTIPNAAGCDSLMTLNLTFRNQTSETFTADVCNSYDWQGMTFTQSGTYYDTIPNAAGCDSLMTLNLTIRNQTSETFTADVCNSYDWQGMTFTQSGTYYDTIPNAAGCDSLMTLNLTTRNTVRDTNAVVACNSYTWLSNGLTYTTSGIYSDTLMAANGCDSISTIDLTINLSTSSTFSMTSCDSYLWSQNGMTYNTTGMYKDTIPNTLGCDSVITLDLTIDTVDTRVVRVGFDLQAQNTNLNATYQWIDCHTNTAIVGATSSTYTVVTNGSYQLEVNQSNCTDTSDCITIMNVGIEINNRKNLDFRLFPNPTKKWVNIEISELNKKDKIYIYNIQGRLIKIILPLSNLSKINLYDFASGIYFVRYRNETRKMIVND